MATPSAASAPPAATSVAKVQPHTALPILLMAFRLPPGLAWIGGLGTRRESERRTTAPPGGDALQVADSTRRAPVGRRGRRAAHVRGPDSRPGYGVFALQAGTSRPPSKPSAKIFL